MESEGERDGSVNCEAKKIDGKTDGHAILSIQAHKFIVKVHCKYGNRVLNETSFVLWR